MDVNRDELRRQLRAADQQHEQAMTSWREALLRIFVGREDAPEAARVKLAGAPDRRAFLRLGGMSVAGVAIIASCGKDTEDPGQSGTTVPTTTAAPNAPSTTAAVPTTKPTTVDAETDLSLLRTATSIELLAVDIYGTALPLLKDPTVKAVAALFRDQHREHADALQATTRRGFGPEKVYDKPNEFLAKNVVAPSLPNLTTDLDIARFALGVENTAASTYVFAASQLSTTELRLGLMAIGGVEARHAAILSNVADSPIPAAPFFTIRDAVPKEALV